jgi:hypothetical protein
MGYNLIGPVKMGSVERRLELLQRLRGRKRLPRFEVVEH